MDEIRDRGLFRLKLRLFRLFKDSRGQGLVEYALILVLVSFGAVATQQVLACEVGCAMELTGKRLENFMSIGKKIPPGQLKKCSKMCT